MSEDRQRTEAHLQSEERWRAVFENSAIGIALVDLHGRFLATNSAYQRMVGYSPDEFHALRFIDITHEDDRDLNRRLITELLEGMRDQFQIEKRYWRKDGTLIWVRNSVSLIPGGERMPLTMLALVEDITERKQSEAAMRTALAEIQELKDQLQRENIVLREEIDKTSMFEEIVGSSPPLRIVLAHVSKVAPTDSTVLITGETGTGKELVARAIHKRSARASRAFVSVNCAAIPSSLIASELFGHEKGAFTGALQRRIGRFESANGGTIFLDEIGELPAETQIALLRVLQEREIERVGDSRPIHVDVRVLAATNRDLKAVVAAGTFRQDLFYRLNVFPIQIPSLRERVDDIPLLVEYLIERYAKKAGKTIRHIRKRTLELFQAYDWPGNIRELQNIIERAIVLCDGETFSVNETWVQGERDRQAGPAVPLAASITEREREMIEAALAQSRGQVSGPTGAAARLGIPRQTLDSKIKSLGIDKHRFTRHAT